MKTPILTTGLDGLVGTRIAELLNKELSFTNLSFQKGYDITNITTIEKAFANFTGEWVWHLAAATDVDRCEKEKDWAHAVNVIGTQNIVNLCKRYKKRLLFISTDFVFHGNNKIYSEKDKPSPINYYGQTKYEAEKLVSKLGKHGLIVRISFPYCAKNNEKKDFFHTILEKLQKKERVMAVDDMYFTPTFIDDIAEALHFLTIKGAFDIYHVTGSSLHTPYEATQLIADTFNLNKSLALPCSFSDYYQNRAPRPKSLKISNQKITKFGLKMHTFSEGLSILKTKI